MNPDACRDVMDRSRIPYENASELNKIMNGLDDISLRKQLPLRQQANKPVLKYNTSMTKTVHLFSQGDGMYDKRDPIGPGSYPQNGLYYTGNVVPSQQISSPESKLTSRPPRQQHSHANQPVNHKHSTTSNPYVRPVSASEIAANINGEKSKQMVVAAATISGLADYLPISNSPETLQRNSFLRPLSGTSGHKDKQTPVRQPTIKHNQSESPTLQRQNSSGSESSVKRFSECRALRHSMFQFASTMSTMVTDSAINKQNVTPSSYPSTFPSNNEHRHITGAGMPTSIPCTKPYLDNVIAIAKQAVNGLENVPSYSQGADRKNSLGSTSANIVPSTSIQTNTTEQTKPAMSSSTTPGTENMSLKKMPVTNTLTGTIYYRKVSASSTTDSNVKPVPATAVQGNLEPPNKTEKTVQEQVIKRTVAPSSQANSQGCPVTQVSSKPPASRPPFERSNASAQLVTKSKTPEIKNIAKQDTSQSRTVITENILASHKSASPTKDLNVNRETTSEKTKTVKNRKKVPQKTKLSPDRILAGAMNSKNMTSDKPSSVSAEQRPSGDGAPVKYQRVREQPGNMYKQLIGTVWDEAEESDDVDDDSDDEDDDRGSDSSPAGERLPGDGEASFEDDEEQALADFEENISDDEASDGYSIQSATSGASSRPVTAHSAQLHSSSGDDLIKAQIRPATASGNVVIKPAFRYSMFKGIPPTINFVSEGEKAEQLPLELRKLFKWKMSPITPIVVKSALARVGFRISKKNHDWLGCFGKHMKSQCFKSLREYQKLNHFPGSFQIGRKDKLWRSLSRLQNHFGKREFNFFPQTFVLPCDLKLLKRVWEEGTSKQKWIIKPPASARGIGIKVISKWTQIPRRRPVIVQKYIHRPFLINSSKFDMRVYVYVSSYDPLRLYVYEDGLARFASCKYSSSMKSLNNRYMHLTNYSVNKKNVEYLSNTDNTVCQGHKWSLKALWNYLRRQGINTTIIWDNIRDLVIKTIISGDSFINSMTKSNARSRYCCHELFGFDILLDENLKTWILEVNISPSLHSNSQLDINIKGGMIKDMLNIAGFRLPDERDLSNSSNHDMSSSYAPSNKFCMDRRLFTNQLAPDERAKHAYYCQKFQDEQIMQSILDTITPDDTRVLCESIDEDSRKGNFQRLFPTPHTHRYLKYFEQPRYYNLLLDQWVLRYNRMEQRGIMLLQSFCDEGLHLQNPTNNPRHQWTPPNSSLATFRAAEMRPLGPQHSARGAGPVPPVPRILKKIPPKTGQLSQSSSSNSLSSLVSTNHSATHSPSPITPLNAPSR